MNIELANFLKKAAEHCGNEADIREEYSGRGMYGRSTAAVVVNSLPELMLNVIQYTREIVENNQELEDVAVTLLDAIPEVADLGRLRTDSMGHDTILY